LPERHATRKLVPVDYLLPRSDDNLQAIAASDQRRPATGTAAVHIAIVTELFYPHVGGQEVRYAELARHLTAADNDVTVLTIAHAPTLPAEDAFAGARVLRLVSDDHYLQRGPLTRNPATIFRFSKYAYGHLRELKPDVVVFNQWPVVPAFHGRKLQCPSVVDICEFRSGMLWRYLERRMVRGCDKVMTVSESLLRKANERWGSLDGRAIPSGVNVAQYRIGGRDHFLYLGRLTKHKHPEVAIEAVLEHNSRTGESMPIRVVGEGEMLPALKARYVGHDAVRFAGHVSEREKIALLADAEMLLLPSVREGFPRVIAEAIASGVPILTIDALDNGSRDVVRHYDVGMAVPLGVESFAAGISQARSDYERFVTNALRRRDELDWSHIVRSFVDFVTVQ
jgi:glycosyltransferase involved in cell wall biosynthesis